MSKKSRARTARRLAERQAVSPLEGQKRHAAESGREATTLAMFMLILTVIIALCFLIGARGDVPLGILLMLMTAFPAGLTVYWAIQARKQRGVALLYDGITRDAEEVITIRCVKTELLERQISRFSSYVFCIILHAEDGRSFCYVYPEKGVSTILSKATRAHFVGKDVTLTCYRGTEAVKSFELLHP